MNAMDRETGDEQQRIDLVERQLDRELHALEERIGETKSEVVSIRKHFWDDVTLNLDDPDELVETHASIKQQAELLSERERMHRQDLKRRNILLRLKQSPYFGRIDFREELWDTEQVYIGLASLLDEEQEHFLIYDWRAPIASLYYDYAPGPAQYATPNGIIKGMMELKRQYIIRDGRLEGLFDTGVTIGDEMLKEVLGQQSNPHMKSIVATIQKEQNRIIRNEHSKLLIVQGAAGSGKTSAALQRVAYLLYRYRGTLQAEQIVLFSPNPLFSSYVATVLPELGEENMQQTTLQAYNERMLGHLFQVEDPFTQLEYVYSFEGGPGYETRLQGIRYKSSLAYMARIDRYAQRLGREGLCFRDIMFRDEVLFSAEQLYEKFYSFTQTVPIANRLRLLKDWLQQEVDSREREERTKDWVQEEIQYLDNETYLKVYRELRKRNRFSEESFDDFEREEEILSAMVVKQFLKPVRDEIKRLHFLDMPAVYRRLFTDPHGERHDGSSDYDFSAIAAHTAERLDLKQLPFEDAAPYLYLQGKIRGFPVNTNVRHVFIDEAQDYSPFQLTYLKKLFPNSRMTLLGDFRQAIFAHASAEPGGSMLSADWHDGTAETVVLTRSYRSTRQIVEFTRRLVPDGEEIEPFDREGQVPTLTHAADANDLTAKIEERIRLLKSAGHRTIAVLCKTAAESREAYETLAGVPSIRLIQKETISFEPSVLVIPSYLAKGVEFDAVILYNASQDRYGRESDRLLFYTACTRAMHELHLFYKGEKSMLLKGVPQ